MVIIINFRWLDDISASLAVARDLTTQGYRLSVLALGATQPDTDALRDLARTGGGAFSVLTASDHDLDNVLLELDQASSMQARMGTGGRTLDRTWCLVVAVTVDIGCGWFSPWMAFGIVGDPDAAAACTCVRVA